MTTFAVTMVKDEADVIAGTLRHMADEVDELIVADNGSTDGTRDVLADLARDLPMTVLDDPDPAYHQSAKMTNLAALAAENGAEWIVPFDADELWFHHVDRVGVVLSGLDPEIGYVSAAIVNHFATSLDEPDVDPFRSMVWRQRDPQRLGKVAFRWERGAIVHQGNHGVTLPSGRPGTPVLSIRHFPYRSPEQMITKAVNGAAAYAATDYAPSVGAHWRAYGQIHDRLGDDGIREVFTTHFWYLSPTDSGLVRDPAPYLRWAACG